MGANRKFDIELRIRVTKEMDEILVDSANKLSVNKADVIRMLIKNLQLKGIEKVIGE